MTYTQIFIVWFILAVVSFVFLFMKKQTNSIKNTVKNFLIKKEQRIRLSLMCTIETDCAKYHIYNTETLPGVDWVNIEIERNENGIKKIILEKEIFDDSFGAMGGSSFHSLVIDARNHLNGYIKQKGEFIISQVGLL